MQADATGELKNPFSSRLWTMRRAVQRGYEALYTVQVRMAYSLSPLPSCAHRGECVSHPF
jgi:hypothetical protein